MDPDQTLLALQGCVLFAILSPFSNELSDMLHRVARLRELESNSILTTLVSHFTTIRIIAYPFVHQEELLAFPALAKADPVDREFFKSILRLRVTQHNIRVLAAYYSRLKLERAAELLGKFQLMGY